MQETKNCNAVFKTALAAFETALATFCKTALAVFEIALQFFDGNFKITYVLNTSAPKDSCIFQNCGCSFCKNYACSF